MNVLEYNYTLYDKDPNRDLGNQEVVQLHEFHFKGPQDNADVWRQYRLMEPLFKTLSHTKHLDWLSVGDGAYGLDSIRMLREGYQSVLPTDIDEKLLKVSHEGGHIARYSVENAENLSFNDDSFDYVLCKDSFHHFPRPYIALYEMLRVARRGVVLIEPQDPWVDNPVHLGPQIIGYESVGNYVYTVSRRELEKVSLGLDLPAVAFKSLYDECPAQIERILVSPLDNKFNDLVTVVHERQKKVNEGQEKGNILFAILFKATPDIELINKIQSEPDGWSLKFYPGNPHRTPEGTKRGETD